MAHLWFRTDDEEESWSTAPLNGHAVDITASPPRLLTEGFRLGEDTSAAVIRAGTADSPVWVLLTIQDGEVRVNGFAPVAGIRVLEDRDEIRAAASGTVFFSTESLAHATPFQAAERAIHCPRCRQPLLEGQMAVRCPRCGVWYHQHDGLPCWTYAPTCGFCPQSTALDAGFQWIPEA
jgi:hypothetical protein